MTSRQPQQPTIQKPTAPRSTSPSPTRGSSSAGAGTKTITSVEDAQKLNRSGGGSGKINVTVPGAFEASGGVMIPNKNPKLGDPTHTFIPNGVISRATSISLDKRSTVPSKSTAASVKPPYTADDWNRRGGNASFSLMSTDQISQIRNRGSIFGNKNAYPSSYEEDSLNQNDDLEIQNDDLEQNGDLEIIIQDLMILLENLLVFAFKCKE